VVVVVVVVAAALVVVGGCVVVVVSGSVVVVVVGAGSVVGGSVPARAGAPNQRRGAITRIVATTARAVDEERWGVDIARSRRAPSPGRPPHHKLSVDHPVRLMF
jgi:hypothetical protein